MKYAYEVADCDVLDKERLASYRSKRSEWLYLLAGDPDHAVLRQITSMLWNDAVFRTANEARRLTRIAGYKSSARNWSISAFLDQGFVAVQTLSIRKLLEKAARNPSKQVVSLRRVLDDIFKHKHLITREIFVSYDGLPFDPQPGKEAFFRKALARGGGVHSEWLPTSGPDAWEMASRVHSQFDRLSASSSQSRNDPLHDDVFTEMERTLKDCGAHGIVETGNKFIAHAADENSRADISKGFSLNDLEACHEAICRVFATLFGTVLYESDSGMLPIPQFDHFENLEAVWAKPDDVAKLSAFWGDHVRKVEAWRRGLDLKQLVPANTP